MTASAKAGFDRFKIVFNPSAPKGTTYDNASVQPAIGHQVICPKENPGIVVAVSECGRKVEIDRPGRSTKTFLVSKVGLISTVALS